MKRFSLPLSALALMCTFSFSLHAQTTNVTPYIAKNLSQTALNNILNAERVFCYNVSKAPSGYTGYTLNQLAITGYCGQIGEEKDIFVEGFFKTPSSILETKASCQIEPKIMFRFIRGIDSTDVLFSDTCPSVTVFYGGTMKAFNAEPVKKPLETIVNVFENQKTDFVSPALLNQLMPTGIAVNEEQQTLVNQQKAAQPKRNWAQQNEPVQNNNPEPKKFQGWNKLGKK